MVKRLEFDTSPKAGRPLLLVGLVVLSLIITTVWYREGESGPIHTARRIVLAAGAPFALAGSWLSTPLRALSFYVSDAAVSRDEYLAVRKQNDELKARLAQLEEAGLENERIRELVDFAQAKDYTTVGARVIGRPADSWERTIIVDRGSRDGVKTGAAVIAAGGLVGQVIEVTAASAKVRLITDSRSGVAVIVQRTRAEGVVRGSLDGQMTLDFVSKDTMPVVGDVLLTSGMGGAYPKGVVVGEVTDVAAPQADLFPKVKAASRVPIDRIEEVLVLTGPGTESQAGANE
jgi:rod shape-determining protein MreC